MDELNRLDELSATHVMGWRRDPGLTDDTYWNVASNKFALHVNDWQPTRNIAQAWECLEKLNPKYFEVRKTEYASAPMYVAEIAVPDAFDARARDRSIAVCIVKACLKAKGVEIG